ncbi:MAG: sigma-70 family RNA polymerase sigma factor [Candidatus Eisenbacteria bacterium]|nr:sigma-70 family RNA polymerase sigma factor [Candidatus Eisenbacteria bacterium]
MDLDTEIAELESWRAGDRKAADALIRRHHGMIRRVIHNKVPAQALDDLTQQVFTALVERRDQIRAGASVRAYILVITKRVIADYYRRSRGRPLDVDDIDQHTVADLGAGPVTMLLARREHRLLLEALRAIPLEDQFILELKYWEDVSGPELTQIYEATEPAIRSRLRRAKERLTAKVAELTRDCREFADTVTDLDAWAQRLREELRTLYPGAQSLRAD